MRIMDDRKEKQINNAAVYAESIKSRMHDVVKALKTKKLPSKEMMTLLAQDFDAFQYWVQTYDAK